MKLIFYLQLFVIVFFGFYAQTIVSQSTVCPSLDIMDILKDPVVQNALQTAWVNSQEGTENEHEEGGWIVHIYEDNPDNICKEYRTEIVTWASGGLDGISSGAKPSIENGRVVADFHTHPGSVKGEDHFVNHVPSKADLNASTFYKIPGIIRYGTGITPSTTFDLVYDGSKTASYHTEILEGSKTDLAGFYDTRIASPEELEGADYEASDPEWSCEDHTNLPASTIENNEVFEIRSSIAPNPIQHVDQVLFFDYKVKLEIDFMSMIHIESYVYVNSADGSLAIIKEDMDAFRMMFRGRLPYSEKFDMHYIVLDANNDESSKLAYYGEDKEPIFIDASPFVGGSVKVENHFFDNCFFNGLEFTEEYATYESKLYPWYKTEVTTRGEKSELRIAMKPTELVSNARYFNSFVGVYKDFQSKQNFLIVEFKSIAIHAKLLDITLLESPLAVDLKPYTVLAEYDAVKGISKYNEETELEDIQEQLDKAMEMYKECVRNLPDKDKTKVNIQKCWDDIIKPLKDKYPHFVPES